MSKHMSRSKKRVVSKSVPKSVSKSNTKSKPVPKAITDKDKIKEVFNGRSTSRNIKSVKVTKFKERSQGGK